MVPSPARFTATWPVLLDWVRDSDLGVTDRLPAALSIFQDTCCGSVLPPFHWSDWVSFNVNWTLCCPASTALVSPLMSMMLLL